MSKGHSGARLGQGPIGPFVASTNECSPLRIGHYLGKTDFWSEVCHPISFVFAEELVARSTSPNVHRAHDVTVVDEIDHAVIDDIVLVSLQDQDLNRATFLS